VTDLADGDVSKTANRDAFKLIGRLASVWVLALAMALVIVLAVHQEQRPAWFVLAIGVAFAVTIIVQVQAAQREGFIARVSFGVAVSTLIILLTAVLGLL
jgi:hypothetical protein